MLFTAIQDETPDTPYQLLHDTSGNAAQVSDSPVGGQVQRCLIEILKLETKMYVLTMG
jgi:hypothetical protein